MALSQTVWAKPEAEATLSLQTYLEEVEAHFPLLQAAELEKDIAEAEVLSAEGGFDVSWKTKGSARPVAYYESVTIDSGLEQPTALWGASAFAGWRLGSGEFAVYDGKKQTLEYGEIYGGLNVPLWKDGPIDKRRAALARAELGRELASLSVSEQRIALRRLAAHRYWSWVAAGRYLAIAERLLRNVESRAQGLTERSVSGDAAAVDVTDNARAVAQRKNQMAYARRLVEKSTIELALLLLGSPAHARVSATHGLPTKFPEPSRRPAPAALDVKGAQLARPEAREAELLLKQAQVDLDLAKNQMAPGIDLQVMGSKDFGADIQTRPDLPEPVLEVSVLLDIPLQRREMKGKAQSASAKAAQYSLKQSLAKRKIEAELRDADSAIRAALSRLAAARQELALTRELEEAERSRFEQGDSTILFVNLREQQTAEAELRENDALLDYFRAEADLRAAQGK